MRGMKHPVEPHPHSFLVAAIEAQLSAWGAVAEHHIKRCLLYLQGWGNFPTLASHFPIMVLIHALQPVGHNIECFILLTTILVSVKPTDSNS